MKTEKSLRWRVCILGTINGLIYSVVLMHVNRLYSDYLYQRNLEAAEQFGSTPDQITYGGINWGITFCWFVLLFTAASYFGHRYWTKYLKSPLLLWIVMGVAAVVGWNILLLTFAWIDMQTTGQSIHYKKVISPTELRSGPASLALVILVNLTYSTIIQLSSRLYSVGKVQP